MLEGLGQRFVNCESKASQVEPDKAERADRQLIPRRLHEGSRQGNSPGDRHPQVALEDKRNGYDLDGGRADTPALSAAASVHQGSRLSGENIVEELVVYA